MLKNNTPLELGRVTVTRTLLNRLRLDNESDHVVRERDLAPLLRRHASGDWGTVDDPWHNDAGLEDGGRILSAYDVRGVTVWVMTDSESVACAACWAGIGRCEPDLGEWSHDMHFRTDLPPRRLATTILLPEDY